MSVGTPSSASVHTPCWRGWRVRPFTSCTPTWSCLATPRWLLPRPLTALPSSVRSPARDWWECSSIPNEAGAPGCDCSRTSCALRTPRPRPSRIPMLLKRIIPCLDTARGRVVKGTHFQQLRDQGDPVALARKYSEDGADELTFLDIDATPEGRATLLELVERTAHEVFIPLTVGGGIHDVDEIRILLRAGADKVSIQTAEVQRPELITEGARAFGSQCIVIAIDAKWEADDRWQVYTHGGRQPSGLDA